MSEHPFVSIVMPVYNGEAYIAAAVDGVRAQTFSDWELIVVDDCSTDGTAQVCAALAATDRRVRVMRPDENRGAGHARNVGLAAAAGEYLAFLDADDAVDADWLERAVGAARRQDADIVLWGAIEEYRDAAGHVTDEIPVTYPDKVLDTPDAVRDEIIRIEASTLLGYPWNKLFRLERVRQSGAAFPDLPFDEDIAFNLQVFPHAARVVTMSMTPLHYRRQAASGSLTDRYQPDYFAVATRRVRALLALYREWGRLTEEVYGILASEYSRFVFAALTRLCDPRAGASRADRRAWLTEQYDTDLYRTLAPHARPAGKAAAVLAWLLRGRHTGMALTVSRMLYRLKASRSGVFNRAKRSR